MKISVPLNNEDTILSYTDVEDSTATWVNTSPEDIPIDAKFQEDGKIYQNITLDVIPVATYDVGDTYELRDLVFTDDAGVLPAPLVHEITGTTGDYPKQPEDYAILPSDTSYDDSTWDARYMKMTDIPLGASLHGTSYEFDAQNVTAFCFSYDGTIMWVGADEGSVKSTVWQCSLANPYDVSDITNVVEGTSFNDVSISDIDMSRDGFNLLVTAKTFATLDRVTYNRKFSISDDITSSVVFTKAFYWTVSFEYQIRSSKWDPTGDYLYVSDNTHIYKYFLSSAYDIDTLLEDSPNSTSPALPYSVLDFSFSDNGKTTWVMYTPTPLTGKAFIREYTSTVAYATATLVYGGKEIDAENTSGRHCRMSSDGTKLFELCSNYGVGSIYQLDIPLATANNISFAYYSVFPLEHTETRNSIDYKWEIEYLPNSSGGYIMHTYRNDVYDNYSPLLYFDSIALDTPELEEKAYIGTNGVWLAKTLIVRPEGVYIRTNTDAEVETEAIVKYRYELIENVSEIAGMVEVGHTTPLNPFDGKNYTVATRYSSMTYTIASAIKFDTLALGNMRADHIVVEFYRAGESTPVNTIDRAVDSSRDTLGNLPDWSTTNIAYSDEVLAPVGELLPYVKVTLSYVDNKLVELGTLLLGISADAGFTNLTLANQYKDYSTFITDDFGNVDYVERAKVSKYSGTVDIRITNYDMTDRLMTSLGANLVIINGSDTTSCGCDSVTVFSATQKIGRITSFSQKTNIADGDLDVMATYSFTFEGVV